MSATILEFPRRNATAERTKTTDGNPMDPYAEAFRAIRRAQRAGLPVPRLEDLLPVLAQNNNQEPAA